MDNFVLGAFLLSGASGLVYEVVWTRALSVMVGGTALASQAVLATFFAGTTLGAFWLGRRLARSDRGARAYARLEAGIGGAGLLSLGILSAAPRLVAVLTDGREGVGTALVALAVTAVACGPATLLMGATFAAATRALGQIGGADPSRLLGRAYAANTSGAVIGALVSGFVALPLLGVRGTLFLAVIGNLGAAFLVAGGLRKRGFSSVQPTGATENQPRRGGPPEAGNQPRRGMVAAALGSGLAGISLQIVALRILAVTLHDTVYTFALAVAAYILGAALGAALFSRYASSMSRVRTSPAAIFAFAAVASSWWLLTLRLGIPLQITLTDASASFADSIGVEAIVAVMLAAPIAVPTTWAFLSLARSLAPDEPALGAGLATAWNGVGCAVAPMVSALVLLPAGGTRAVAIFALAVLLVSALCLSTGVVGRPMTRFGWVATAVVLATATPLWFVRDGLFIWKTAPGYQLLWKKEGSSVAVAIETSATGQRRLRTNNNFTEGGDAALIIQLRQGLVPTVFAPHARRALVLGVGSGGTLAGVVAGLPGVAIDAVELVPEVTQALGYFDGLHGGVERDPAVDLHIADARTFVAHAAARGETYDLVVGELFHAQQAGTGALYALEHFRNVHRALAPGGVYCQWVPLHETPPEVTPAIVRTFFSVFPQGAAFFGTWNLQTPILGLVGSDNALRARWHETARWLGEHPRRLHRAQQSLVASLADTFATFIADAAGMRAWAGPGPSNSDDRPLMEFESPRGFRDTLGITNVLALLRARQPPDGVVDYPGADERAQVAALQAASADFFLGSDAWRREDLELAERHLLAAAGRAPEFAPARQALSNLSGAWREAGRDDRARALSGWLARLPAHD